MTESGTTQCRHNDPHGPFGYVPTDDWMRAFGALQKAESARDSEARCLADAVVMPEDEAWRIPIRAEYYRRALANNDYARGVWGAGLRAAGGRGMSVSLDMASDYATVTASPEHGRTVVFEVRLRSIKVSRSPWDRRRADRYVVGLLGSNGDGFSDHVQFERAVSSALVRARRYDRAYSRQRVAVSA